MKNLQAASGGLSRREFLQFSGLGILALAPGYEWFGKNLQVENGLLGRIVDPTIHVYNQPYFGSDKLYTFWRDDVLSIDGALIGDRFPEHNRVWYEVRGLGFAHSSAVQPVLDIRNRPVRHVPEDGQLAEVTVPFVDAVLFPRMEPEPVYRYYFGTTHWVTDLIYDGDRMAWYQVSDQRMGSRYYVPADALRLIPERELTPISAEVPPEFKRIEVDLGRQMMHCYEDTRRVYTARISSGRNIDRRFSRTPEGTFVIVRKRPSRHMAVGNLAAGYDLPGVPWVSYITDWGIAFHGTYWHNDFGAPHSHGCLNMSTAASKWLFRWTQPDMEAAEREVWVRSGTKVSIAA